MAIRPPPPPAPFPLVCFPPFARMTPAPLRFVAVMWILPPEPPPERFVPVAPTADSVPFTIKVLETFRRITRRSGVDKVLEGILAARRCGFRGIRLNAVAIRGITEDEVIPLAEFARDHELELRFIEFMPLDAEQRWEDQQVISGEELRARLEVHFGPLIPTDRAFSAQPAKDYEYADGSGRVGFISSVTEPFCETCNRLRITAEGKIRNCLFSSEEWDARAIIRGGGSDEELAKLVRTCVGQKKAGHGVDTPQDLRRPERAMYQIGG